MKKIEGFLIGMGGGLMVLYTLDWLLMTAQGLSVGLNLMPL